MTLRVISGDDTMQLGVADYVWTDLTGEFHTKNRVIEVYGGVPRIERWVGVFPSPDEEVILSPCYYVPDPFRPQPCYVVLCEVRNMEDVAHKWNKRATLRAFLEHKHPGPLVGFRQLYEMNPQVASSYQVAEKQMGACVDAGLMIRGASFYEELPDWYFEIAPRNVGMDEEQEQPVINLCDHLMIARYFLGRAAAELDVPLALNGGTALVYPMNADPEVMADYLRSTGRDVRLRATALEINGLPLDFDPYQIVYLLHMDTVQLEQKA